MSQDYAAPAGAYQPDDVVDAPVYAPYSLLTRLAAEAFGTMLLVLGVVGTATFNILNLQGTILTIALAGGIMLMAAFAAVGHISGGHFNPAVTFGMALAGRTSWRDLLPYWLAQFVGGIVAAAVIWAVVPTGLVSALGLETRGDLLARTANGWGDRSGIAAATQGQVEFPLLNALIVEVVVAAVFVGVFLAVTKRPRSTPPAVVIGFTLAALYIISWPATNTSFNPARSVASVVFSGNGKAAGQLWLFIVAPLVGAGLAALFALIFAPARVAPEGAVIDEVEDTYEVMPVVETQPVAPVAPVVDVVEAEPVAPVAEPAPSEAAAEDAAVTEAAADEAAADDVAAPEGSKPEKPQA